MPEIDEIKNDLVDVGEEEGAEINLDEKGNPEKPEVVVEEKIEVEEVKAEPIETKKETIVAEEKKPDELKEYSEGVQKRIAKLTRKMREAERQKEEALTYAHTIKSQKEQAEKRLSKLDKSYVSEFESRVKTNLAAAKLALKNAIESQNVEAQISAQEQLATLSVENARLSSMKSAEKETVVEKEVNITPQRQQANVQSDPRAEDWATRNSWFGNNSAMTYTAFDIHKKLVEEEG